MDSGEVVTETSTCNNKMRWNVLPVTYHCLQLHLIPFLYQFSIQGNLILSFTENSRKAVLIPLVLGTRIPKWVVLNAY